MTSSGGDKAAIDADLVRLCRAAGVKVKLPAARQDPKIGPFSHFRDALKVLPRDKLLAKLPAFKDSWSDMLLRYMQNVAAFSIPRMDEVLATKVVKVKKAERAILEAGLVALVHLETQQLLVLSPSGPGASVFAAGASGLELLGSSVAEFVQRDVDAILGAAVAAIAPMADVLARVEAKADTRKRVAGIRKGQVPAKRVEGALVYGLVFDDLQGPDHLLAIDDLARSGGLTLYFGRGDAENATDSELATASWLVGIAIESVAGGAEQKAGFELEVGEAKAKVDMIVKAAAAVARGGKLTVGKPGLYLVARGGACVAWLVRGTWLDAPAKVARKPDALSEWLDQQQPVAKPGSPEIGVVRGTRGASQQAYPAVVRGVCVAGADSTFEAVGWSAAREKGMDRALTAGGIARPRYYLVTRFD